MFTNQIKRLFDLVLSALAILALTPLLAVAALAIALTMGRPIFFRQVRPGYREKPFTLLKFRTMAEASGLDGTLLPDEERLTGLGRLLRKTSIDELPSLYNVLKGEMSLVGPRPWISEYLPSFTDQERRRFLVRPGLTGLAQVNGRNLASWDQRIANDLNYVDNRSFWLDLRIIGRTVAVVLRGKGVAVACGTVMPRLDDERRARVPAGTELGKTSHVSNEPDAMSIRS